MDETIKKSLFFKYDKGLVPMGTDLHHALTYIKELEKLNEQFIDQQRADGETIKKLSEVKRGRPKKDRVREGSSSRSIKCNSKD